MGLNLKGSGLIEVPGQLAFKDQGKTFAEQSSASESGRNHQSTPDIYVTVFPVHFHRG
jgi:hypothetical protein